jgi:putative addiction module component (TIGR02574 family)
MNAQAIVTAASQLPETDRVHVIEALLESLDPVPSEDPEQVAHAWRVEVARRSDELRTGKVEPVPWSEVRAEGDRLLHGGD